MAREAELFVVCKNCGSEVSPYVTECPYCGQRVRKRAPKIDRGSGGEPKPPKARRRVPRPSPTAPKLGRLRRGELPGVRADGRPLVTWTLVLACFVVYLLAVGDAIFPFRLVLQGPFDDGVTWHALTAPFVHFGGGGSIFAGGAYQFATMVGVGVFGWLLENRHGHVTVALLALLCGAGGMAITELVTPDDVAFGANGMALGLLAAWTLPDLLRWRRDQDYEADLVGVAVIAAVLLLMPAVVDGSSAVAGVSGALLGLVAGVPLARRAV